MIYLSKLKISKEEYCNRNTNHVSDNNRENTYMKYSTYLEKFLDFIRSAENIYKEAYEKVHEMDQLTQDYLHDIELGGFDYKGRAKIATKLKEARKIRRVNKDITIPLRPVRDWVITHRGTINELQQLLGEVRKEEKALNNRFYIRKVDIDVTKEQGETET